MLLTGTRQQRSQGLVNVAAVADVINLQAGFCIIDPVDDAIAPYAMGTVTIELTG
jgi:hypothetical protein